MHKSMILILCLASSSLAFPQEKSQGAEATKVPPRPGATNGHCELTHRAGVCTPYYMCDKEVSTADGEIDIAGGQDVPCDNYLTVCCAVVHEGPLW